MPQIVFAIATTIVAINIVIGWITGAFSRDSVSGTLSALFLNLTLVLIAATGTAAAVFYWRKFLDSERFISDMADRLEEAEQPKGPPVIPDVTDPGYPPLSTRQLADLYADGRVIGERAYSDAKLCAIAIISMPNDRPSIRMQFDFYSEHARKVAEVNWDNYGGFNQVLAGQELRPLQESGGWDQMPWETYPQWEKFYRLAYEKVQPLPDPPLVIVTSFFSHDGRPWVFQFGRGPGAPHYALTADEQLIEGSSVYARRIALSQTVREAFERRPHLARE